MTATLLDLAAARTVLLDGGLGTELMKRGIPQGFCPELWNVENPEALRGVHADYFAAGSDVVTTNSFGGHPLKLEAYGLRGRAAELNREAARNAAAVRPRAASSPGAWGRPGSCSSRKANTPSSSSKPASPSRPPRWPRAGPMS